jgi:hypothetical protein
MNSTVSMIVASRYRRKYKDEEKGRYTHVTTRLFQIWIWDRISIVDAARIVD